MAVVVPFPTPLVLTCGKLANVPMHIWPDGAKLGDPCVCGATRLTIDPAHAWLHPRRHCRVNRGETWIKAPPHSSRPPENAPHKMGAYTIARAVSEPTALNQLFPLIVALSKPERSSFTLSASEEAP